MRGQLNVYFLIVIVLALLSCSGGRLFKSALDPSIGSGIEIVGTADRSVSNFGHENWPMLGNTPSGSRFSKLTFPLQTQGPGEFYYSLAESNEDAFPEAETEAFYGSPVLGWESEDLNAEKRLYAVTEEGRLVCYNAETLEYKWRFPEDPIDPQYQNPYETASTPAVGRDGTIYFWNCEDGPGKLYAVTPAGDAKWTEGEVDEGFLQVGMKGTTFSPIIMEAEVTEGVYEDVVLICANNLDRGRLIAFVDQGNTIQKLIDFETEPIEHNENWYETFFAGSPAVQEAPFPSTAFTGLVYLSKYAGAHGLLERRIVAYDLFPLAEINDPFEPQDESEFLAYETPVDQTFSISFDMGLQGDSTNNNLAVSDLGVVYLCNGNSIFAWGGNLAEYWNWNNPQTQLETKPVATAPRTPEHIMGLVVASTYFPYHGDLYQTVVRVFDSTGSEIWSSDEDDDLETVEIPGIPDGSPLIDENLTIIVHTDRTCVVIPYYNYVHSTDWIMEPQQGAIFTGSPYYGSPEDPPTPEGWTFSGSPILGRINREIGSDNRIYLISNQYAADQSKVFSVSRTTPNDPVLMESGQWPMKGGGPMRRYLSRNIAAFEPVEAWPPFDVGTALVGEPIISMEGYLYVTNTSGQLYGISPAFLPEGPSILDGFPTEVTSQYPGSFSITPSMDVQGQVHFNDSSGLLHGYDSTANESYEWPVQLETPWHSDNTSSPCTSLYGQTLFLTGGGNSEFGGDLICCDIEGNIVWDTSVGHVFGDTVIAPNNWIYCTVEHYVGYPPNTVCWNLDAYNLFTGELEYGRYLYNPVYPYITKAEMALPNNSVVFWSRLDNTGIESFSVWDPDNDWPQWVVTDENQHSIHVLAANSQNTIFVRMYPEDPPYLPILRGYDNLTGEVIFESSIEMSPPVATVDANDVILAFDRYEYDPYSQKYHYRLVALDSTSNGNSELWSITLDDNLTPSSACTIGEDGTIYFLAGHKICAYAGIYVP